MVYVVGNWRCFFHVRFAQVARACVGALRGEYGRPIAVAVTIGAESDTSGLIIAGGLLKLTKGRGSSERPKHSCNRARTGSWYRKPWSHPGGLTQREEACLPFARNALGDGPQDGRTGLGLSTTQRVPRIRN
jgi:hypothetical protein